MRRSRNRWLPGALAILSGIAGTVLAASPASATLVCPPGVTNPAYCTNVVPVATTKAAKPIHARSAALNGTAGPNVKGGDVTDWAFEWGTTSAYGHLTPTKHVGSCPNGASRCSSVPAQANVSAKLGGLTPCQVYHFALIASNPDGTTIGHGRTFRTKYAPPLKHKLHYARTVSAGSRFKLRMTVTATARVTVAFRLGRRTLKTETFRHVKAGKATLRVKAPRTPASYEMRIRASLGCGRQTLTRPISVR